MTNTPSDDLEYPRLTRAVQWVIAINVAIYFVQVVVLGATRMQVALGFSSRDLSSASWSALTILTYMFVHSGFWQLALNMYMLWLFGPRLENAWSAGEFARYYIWCGLGGWFFHLLAPPEAVLIGASAAVYGVMLAYVTRWPDDEMLVFFLVPLRVKWVVALLIATSLVVGILTGGPAGGVAYVAHLGGLAAGWVCLRWSTPASIDRFRQHVSQLPDLPDETPRAIPRSLPRVREKGRDVDDVVARSNAALSRRPAAAPPPPVSRSPQHLTDLDMVLDKISQCGIESLTSSERRLLEDMSKELRRRP